MSWQVSSPVAHQTSGIRAERSTAWADATSSEHARCLAAAGISRPGMFLGAEKVRRHVVAGHFMLGAESWRNGHECEIALLKTGKSSPFRATFRGIWCSRYMNVRLFVLPAASSETSLSSSTCMKLWKVQIPLRIWSSVQILIISEGFQISQRRAGPFAGHVQSLTRTVYNEWFSSPPKLQLSSLPLL